MQVSLSILHHPKDGYAIDLNRLIDVTQIFKKRDEDRCGDKGDFCVYIFEDEFGNDQYIGMGRYYDITHYSTGRWLKSRPFSHRNDLLSNTINPNWTCMIIACGLTTKEAHVLESYIILKALKTRVLSKRNTKEWDRFSLINKRRERKWETMITEYLDNGNNPRIAA